MALPSPMSALRVILARRWIVVGAGLLAGGGALGYSASMPARYEATARVVVAPLGVGAPADPVSALQIADAVLRSPELRESVRRAADMVAAPAPVRLVDSENESVIEVVGSSTTPELALGLVSAYVTQADVLLAANHGLSVALLGAPTRPVEPVSPRPVRDAAAGLVAGLLAGACLALWRDRRDDVIRPGFDVEGFSGLPVLELIHRPSATVRSRLASGRATDDERVLATQILSVMDLRHWHSVGVLGVGRGRSEATALGLASGFVSRARDVAVIDGDLRAPALHSALGLDVRPGLTSLPSGDLSGLRFHQFGAHVEVLTAGGTAARPRELLANPLMRDLIRGLVDDGSIVVVSLHPIGAHDDALGAVGQLDAVLVIIGPGRTRGRDLRRALEQVVAARGNPVALVLTGSGRRRYHGFRHRQHTNAVVQRERPEELARRAEIPLPPPPPASTAVSGATAANGLAHAEPPDAPGMQPAVTPPAWGPPPVVAAPQGLGIAEDAPSPALAPARTATAEVPAQRHSTASRRLAVFDDSLVEPIDSGLHGSPAPVEEGVEISREVPNALTRPLNVAISVPPPPPPRESRRPPPPPPPS